MRTIPLYPAFLLLLALPSHADLARRRDAVVEVVQKVAPAVVHIATQQDVQRRFRSRPNPVDEFFFGAPREGRKPSESLGSGVILDASGVVVTNDHVIRGAAAIRVVLADGTELPGEVIGSDADNDLAVIKVRAPEPLPAARLGTSSDLLIGETAVAIGSPFGLQKTVTAGVISATGRTFKADGRTYNDFVQTDASINPGNSGGPLLNVDGEVIGINTAIFASAQGIGFAIPADKVRRIVRELQQFGKVRPAWVGLEVEDLEPQSAGQLGRRRGPVAVAVSPGSPAETAGVRPGDLVAEVGGTPVESAEDFEVRLRGYPARSSFALTVLREGRPIKTTLTPVEFPPKLAESLAWNRLGLRVRSGRGAVLVGEVRPGSAAEVVGLEPGDAVLRLNNQPVATPEAFRDALLAARTGRTVLLLVQRGRFGYHVPLPL
ncbi:MAG TPA: trypsin-like peptidase domain-containing protein [Myxococcaceae bacterium]|nr:trypsin-like peptidase domain-containing protein [Myxococcaceae bacterium]